jgi:hypothetical protein
MKVQQNKKYEAQVSLPDRSVVETTAVKQGRHWVVGGDVRQSWPKGSKFFILSDDGGIFFLNKNKLEQQ